MYKAVFFDFDGTLANDLNFFVKAYDFALKKFDIHLSEEEIAAKCFHRSEEEIAKTFNIQSAEEFGRYYFEGVDKFINDVPVFPGASSLLYDLQKLEIKLGLVTLAKKWYITKMLKQTGFNTYFKYVVSCDDVKKPKPDPESIYLICKNMQITPANTLFVGDAKGDIIMGKAAGCETALFLPKENKQFYDFEILKLTNPDYIFYNYNDLRKILL